MELLTDSKIQFEQLLNLIYEGNVCCLFDQTMKHLATVEGEEIFSFFRTNRILFCIYLEEDDQGFQLASILYLGAEANMTEKKRFFDQIKEITQFYHIKLIIEEDSDSDFSNLTHQLSMPFSINTSQRPALTSPNSNSSRKNILDSPNMYLNLPSTPTRIHHNPTSQSSNYFYEICNSADSIETMIEKLRSKNSKYENLAEKLLKKGKMTIEEKFLVIEKMVKANKDLKYMDDKTLKKLLGPSVYNELNYIWSMSTDEYLKSYLIQLSTKYYITIDLFKYLKPLFVNGQITDLYILLGNQSEKCGGSKKEKEGLICDWMMVLGGLLIGCFDDFIERFFE